MTRVHALDYSNGETMDSLAFSMDYNLHTFVVGVTSRIRVMNTKHLIDTSKARFRLDDICRVKAARGLLEEDISKGLYILIFVGHVLCL